VVSAKQAEELSNDSPAKKQWQMSGSEKKDATHITQHHPYQMVAPEGAPLQGQGQAVRADSISRPTARSVVQGWPWDPTQASLRKIGADPQTGGVSIGLRSATRQLATDEGGPQGSSEPGYGASIPRVVSEMGGSQHSGGGSVRRESIEVVQYRVQYAGLVNDSDHAGPATGKVCLRICMDNCTQKC